jgi:ArsR family transcriptional regulator
VQETALPQPLVSHHLRILRDGGIARAERRGAYNYY